MTMNENSTRAHLRDKKRIVVKVGSSSLVHPETGSLDLLKLDRLVRVLCDFRNRGLDIVLVTSGAIGVGRKALGFKSRPESLEQKQACASVGQAMLMMIYQKLFREYNHTASQILLTKHTIIRETSCRNAKNTFNELLRLGVIFLQLDRRHQFCRIGQFLGRPDGLQSFLYRTDLSCHSLIHQSELCRKYSDDIRELVMHQIPSSLQFHSSVLVLLPHVNIRELLPCLEYWNGKCRLLSPRTLYIFWSILKIR